MKRIFFYIVCLSLINVLFADKWLSQGSYYDSLYYQSISYTENDKITDSIRLLKEIISKDKNYTNDENILIMNAYYNLGQLYLSRLSDYDLAIDNFNYVFNNIKSQYFSYSEKDKMKNLLDLKEKSLFMIGYTYHNHIGNLSKAKEFYDIFLTNYKDSDLYSSVEYEVEMINQEISNFRKIQKR